MFKVLGVVTIIFGLLAFEGNSSADEFYKYVDAKGTIHFSDNPTSGFFHSQYKEKLIIKDGSVQSLEKLSFGEREIPKDQLLHYYKSEGSGYRRPSRQEGGDESSPRARNRAIPSSVTPFRSSGQGGSSLSGTGLAPGTTNAQGRQIYPRRKIYRR